MHIKASLLLAPALAIALTPAEAKAESPLAEELAPVAPLDWQEFQQWEPTPVVVPEVSIEAEPQPELSPLPAVEDAAAGLLPVPVVTPPVVEPVAVPEPPPLEAPEASMVVPRPPAPAKVVAVAPASIAPPPIAPVKVAAKPTANLSLPPTVIKPQVQSQDGGIQVRPTEQVRPFEKPAPATAADIIVNRNRSPEVRHADEAAQINLQLGARRALDIEVVVLEGEDVSMASDGLKQLTPGRLVSVRAVAGPGKLKLGIKNSEGVIIREVDYVITKQKAIRHNLNVSANASETLAESSDGSVRTNYSASWGMSHRERGWNFGVRAGYSPESVRSVGIFGSYRFD